MQGQMQKKIGNFNVIITEDYEALGRKAAEIIAEQIRDKSDSVIGFATGSTPLSTYNALVEMNGKSEVDFSGVTAFNLDEYYPIKKSNNQSYDYFMKEHLFNHVNINFSKLNIPNGEADDYEAECGQYDEKIERAGGIDIQILGIGLNGHIGFNEPGSIFKKTTHHVALDESTIEANARFFSSKDEVPTHALTMGIQTIMRSKKIILLVNGEKKADIIKRTILGDITPEVPASSLQFHNDVTVIMDIPAAKELM